jgi:hypothetical protein
MPTLYLLVWAVVEKGIVEKYHPWPRWRSLGERNPNFGNNYLETLHGLWQHLLWRRNRLARLYHLDFEAFQAAAA